MFMIHPTPEQRSSAAALVVAHGQAPLPPNSPMMKVFRELSEAWVLEQLEGVGLLTDDLRPPKVFTVQHVLYAAELAIITGMIDRPPPKAHRTEHPEDK